MVFAVIHLMLNNHSDLKSFLVSHFTSRPLPYLQYIMDDRLQWSSELLSETKSMDTIDLVGASEVSGSIPKVVSIGEGIDSLSLTLGSAMDEKPMRVRVRDTALQKIDALDQINRWSSMLSVEDKHSRDAVVHTLEDILSSYKKRYDGVDHPHVGAALHNLSVAYVLFNEQYDRALPLCKEAVRVRKESLGLSHADVIASLTLTGLVYFALEDFDSALKIFNEACDICADAGKSEDIQKSSLLAFILNNIGCILFKQQKSFSIALATFEQALKAHKETLKSGFMPEVAVLNMSTTLFNIGYLLLTSKQYDDANAVFEETLLIQQSILGDNHELVRTTLDNLAFSNGFHF
mmetsp:Transcript_4546/g.6649  ORF Transcript_4546/g.6649 Transcript_4546/m.6649 type:complete len:349 (-) Transcript_4546:297-1343(-)|eukprot:CAMPEP_0116025162 /NCGR_PEP_ID=MMETSP0321-20121206/12856_1 /TAXON_ID=163516 /ORGANISM="Leptocylindrus danicus var. danicus, Strain B650" /LENGTH=348 /DNA_ID=CAMNT_0003497247 /DNA_START=183 /DNA_END=1229 /DNA_ORIENTATION=-